MATIKVALTILAFIFSLFYLILFIGETAGLVLGGSKLKCPISKRNIDIVFPVRPFACWLFEEDKP